MSRTVMATVASSTDRAVARRPVPDPGASRSLGSLLRRSRNRQRLTLARVAQLAETSPSHLSRIETGERTAVGRTLLSRLATILDVDPVELFLEAGRLPPAVESDLADHRLALALVFDGRLPERTRWSLRRQHLGLVAQQTFQPPPAGPVDVIALVRARGYAVHVVSSSTERLQIHGHDVTVASGPLEMQRFLLAHVLAHTVLDEDVTCLLDSARYSPEDEDREAEATALASFILVPTPTLEVAVSDESSRYDVWAGQTGDLLDALAGRLGAPAWVIARRVGEESLFVEATSVEDM
jgi:transcriptional regulator with XRE-family HTH domain